MKFRRRVFALMGRGRRGSRILVVHGARGMMLMLMLVRVMLVMMGVFVSRRSRH